MTDTTPHPLTCDIPEHQSGVNPTLAPKRRFRPVVENDDYAAFTTRVLRAHARRIATGDIEGLAALAALETELDQALRTAVTGLYAFGYSWADIAARLGVTRQAAHQRWATPPPIEHRR